MTSTAQMWEQYVAATGYNGELTGAWQFGDSEKLGDELADLVLHGPKRATAGLLIEFERDQEPLPREGDHSIVLDGRGEAVCVTRTVQVFVQPLADVDEAFAWDEGEGDRSLTWWLEAHTNYFQRRCAELGIEFTDDIATVFERFDLVWPLHD